jgi:hypothetical protein
MRMAWPEKVAVFALAFMAIVLLWFGLTGGPIKVSAGEWAADGLTILLRGALLLVLPLWAVLRAFDMLIGGPARRSGVFIVRPLR